MSTLVKIKERRKEVRIMPLDEAYFVWLYSQVGSVENRNLKKSYWKLLRIFYRKEFVWAGIEKDGNRAQDGKDLRRQFLEDTGREPDDAEWLDMGCSFLEMLVALSWAVAFEGGGTQKERFWEMVGNLGLLQCNDATDIDEDIVNHILDKVIMRDYAPNGAGGLFPLQRHTNKDADQRDVELWYQANTYLLERL